MTSQCERCGGAVTRPGSRGSMPRFCADCREAAVELAHQLGSARKAASEFGFGVGVSAVLAWARQMDDPCRGASAA